MATNNALFVVFHVSDPDIVEEKINAISPWIHLKIDNGSWIVVAPSETTTQEICGKIGIEKGGSNGITLRVDSYFGVASPSIWEWIAAKQGVQLDTATNA